MSQFIYLLNAFEAAAHDDAPSDVGYAEKRKAVLDYVAKLESARPEAGLTLPPGFTFEPIPLTGWKLVPVEPTQPMLTAYRGAMKSFIESQATAKQRARWAWDSRGYVVPEDVKMRARWKAMVDAAPQPDMNSAPLNQCDGCRRGLALDGRHHRDAQGRSVMICERDKYLPKGD